MLTKAQKQAAKKLQQQPKTALEIGVGEGTLLALVARGVASTEKVGTTRKFKKAN